MKYLELTTSRLVPAEVLGVAPCREARRRIVEQLPNGRGQRGRRSHQYDFARFGRTDQIGCGAHIGRHHRCTTGHRFKENVRPTLLTRRMYQHIDRAVDVNQLALRQLPHESYSVQHTQSLGARTQHRLLLSAADDKQLDTRQRRETVNHQVMSLQRYQIAHRRNSRGISQSQLAAGQPAIERLKPLQVDAVAQHPDLAAIDAETDHFLRQLARYRYDRRRFLTRATYRGSGAAE